MSLSLEQRAARAAIVNAMGELLREVWEQEKSEPLPERITRLLAQLDDAETSPASGEPDPEEVRSSTSINSA